MSETVKCCRCHEVEVLQSHPFCKRCERAMYLDVRQVEYPPAPMPEPKA